MADPTPTTTDDPEDICGLCGEPGADKMALYTGDGLPLEATEAPLCAECAAVHDAAPGEDRDAREEAAEIETYITWPTATTCCYGVPRSPDGDPRDTVPCGRVDIQFHDGHGHHYCAAHAAEVQSADPFAAPADVGDRDAREEAAEIARQDRAVEEKAQIERFCFVDADGHAVDCDGVRRPE